MFGDYYTTNLLASTRNTAMVGTLIVADGEPARPAGASLVLLLLIALLFPMLYYLRETSRAAELVSGT
jgi:ABC-type spermidine/putrescine transport system permease subunit I